MFTRRHYEATAQIIGSGIRQAREAGRQVEPAELLAEVGRDFARMFAGDNGRFDRGRFEDRINEYAEGRRR